MKGEFCGNYLAPTARVATCQQPRDTLAASEWSPSFGCSPTRVRERGYLIAVIGWPNVLLASELKLREFAV